MMNNKTRYNEQLIDLLDKISNIMLKHGEHFRAKSYQKAEQTIMTYNNDITNVSQLKGLPGIGSTILDKLNEYIETGTLSILEKDKTNPINILSDIYGVGPKKAQDLVDNGIKTISELRERQHSLLNETQIIGLKYYEQIQQRIPRAEIDNYYTLFGNIFNEFVQSIDKTSTFEIVGSYRRGAESSGDIDVIITGNTNISYKTFVDKLLKIGIILEILSSGPSKTLVIAKLPSSGSVDFIARRIDFLYSPINEFAFAILYFTGSKIFNTVMRQYALNKGYTFNEHSIHKLENKIKGEKVIKDFKTEKDIFDFLGLQFKRPNERRDVRDVIELELSNTEISTKILTTTLEQAKENTNIIPKKNKTLKRKPKTKVTLIIDPNPDNDSETEPETKLECKYEGKLDILQIIENFKHNGIFVIETLNEKQLTDIINFANNKYYNQMPVMTDNQYDIIKEYTEKKYPNNTTVLEIGAEVERNKSQLPYEMPSMDKIKPDTFALTSWISKYNGPYIISCKLDGVSGLYTTMGITPKLYTRGNGKVGQDISHLIPFLRLPNTKDIVIRGELIIPKEVFDNKYKSSFANPRNMVAGIINHKHINDAINDVHFVAYEVIEPKIKPSDQMEILETINVESVLYKNTDNLSNEMLSGLLVELRKTNIYEIDGIIVTNDKIYTRCSGNPEHSFAFKMVLSDQVAEAKVVDVLWAPSKDGYLKPRVQIEPIRLGGVTIEFATGFNAAFIKSNNIGIGSTIELIRSGDVIPYIRSVTIPAEEAKMPGIPYEWNDTHIDIIIKNINDDPTVKEKNITGFFRGIKVDGLSSGNISRLITAGYDSVQKIIKMKETDFLNVDGFKGKMSKKIYTGIQEKLKEASIVTLMAASNIFGRGFSDKKIELILNDLPDILVSNQTKAIKINKVTSIKGMAIKTAELFVNKIQAFKDFMEECALNDKLYEFLNQTTSQSPSKDHILFGKTIVLTGTRDKDIIDFIKQIGANQGSGVNKNTFLVVAKDKNETTGKADEARKLNIHILSVNEFKENYFQV